MKTEPRTNSDQTVKQSSTDLRLVYFLFSTQLAVLVCSLVWCGAVHSTGFQPFEQRGIHQPLTLIYTGHVGPKEYLHLSAA